MRLISATVALVWMTIAAPVWAQNNPVVIELFTSQGCSSCPPADKLLHKLAERDDVIALALHVDYWDYIGWKDEFANPAFTKRQKAYAIVAGRRSVYTPQMVINGQEDVVGSKPMDVTDLIRAHRAKADKVTLKLVREGGKMQIDARALSAKGPLTVQIVRYVPRKEVRITRGENAGHTYSYANVVKDWKTLAEWDGASDFRMNTPVTGDLPVVVLVQQKNHGPILAAQVLR